ncbi:hypothetical protein Syun_006498 [Stephania yunnanensis]|uniref:Uncharacterized protein n=1 Tax=Stephania yunnanensis TaxID=152371 RepID=A0AAP0KYC9_9MAGN
MDEGLMDALELRRGLQDVGAASAGGGGKLAAVLAAPARSDNRGSRSRLRGGRGWRCGTCKAAAAEVWMRGTCKAVAAIGRQQQDPQQRLGEQLANGGQCGDGNAGTDAAGVDGADPAVAPPASDGGGTGEWQQRQPAAW